MLGAPASLASIALRMSAGSTWLDCRSKSSAGYVAFGAGAGDQAGEAMRLQVAEHGAADEAALAGHEDGGVAGYLGHGRTMAWGWGWCHLVRSTSKRRGMSST